MARKDEVKAAIEEQLDFFDPEDDALLRHIFEDAEDYFPQGLHQQGFKQTKEEEQWYDDYLYLPLRDEGFEFGEFC